jgi:hypothetical protein
MYLERFKFFCPICQKPGVITDVLVNSLMMILRGRCAACEQTSEYKAVDVPALLAEHEALYKADQKSRATTSQAVRFVVGRGNGAKAAPEPHSD